MISSILRMAIAAAIASAAVAFTLPVAQAGVVLNGTRVVYPAAEDEVTLKLDNHNAHPSLMQVWMDTGDAKAAPDEVDVPFVITPPVFRLEPTKSQTIRIRHTGDAMPTDRESVFWLNALEVAPKPKLVGDAPNNYMQLAFRTRIKLFYRPGDLPYSVEQARQRITTAPIKRAGGWAVEVDNPTPYHLSLASVAIRLSGRSYGQAPGADSGGMIAPMSRMTFDVHDAPADAMQGIAELQLIDDYGAMVALEVPFHH